MIKLKSFTANHDEYSGITTTAYKCYELLIDRLEKLMLGCFLWSECTSNKT